MPIPIFLKESSLPQVLGGMRYQSVDIYPNRSLGVKVRYSLGDEVKADVYLYNLGHSDISEDLKSQEVLEYYQGAFRDIQAYAELSNYLDFEVRASRYLHIPEDAPDPFCLWGVFAYRQAPGEGVRFPGKRISHLALRTDRGHINKVRFTYPENKDKEDADIELFLTFFIEWTIAVQEFGMPVSSHED